MLADNKHIAREFLTMNKMVLIYCRDRHDGDTPCEHCGEFLDYAKTRLEKCPYGAGKPTCASCPIHCYKADQRARVRMIMRYAGPRMLLHHPLLTLAHKFDGLRRVRHPRELTRAERLKRTGPRRPQ